MATLVYLQSRFVERPEGRNRASVVPGEGLAEGLDLNH